MKVLVRNVFAVVVGFVVGSLVNLGLVGLGMSLIPLPEGADVSTMEGLRESMASFTPANFVFPFLAHALGTLVGAFVAAKLAVGHRLLAALVVGVCFLAGGITMVVACGGPAWFIAADLLLAYLPTSLLAARLAGEPPRANRVVSAEPAIPNGGREDSQ